MGYQFDPITDLLKGFSQSPEYGDAENRKRYDDLLDGHLRMPALTGITMRSGNILDGFTARYVEDVALHHGGMGGAVAELRLDRDPIVRITGNANCQFGGRAVLSNLRVETVSGKTHGPYGSQTNGEPFALSKPGYVVVGFFGSTDGQYCTSLGVYLKKLPAEGSVHGDV